MKARRTADQIKKEMLRDNPKFRAEYEAIQAEYQLARVMIMARQQAGLTQVELAERMGTKQSAIARLESGKRMPAIGTLLKVAEATGQRLQINFVPATTQA